ncbi:peptidoglycan-binding domain-containing protein [Salinicoccus albus]|uniref:peptidoglycan-binding domain-containing protein n=1 Tax=Salinicoccus albus TaxID=418756 RepID=UPI00037D4603|nr:peptidoglycan-binding protein [Salinicoccus albus]
MAVNKELSPNKNHLTEGGSDENGNISSSVLQKGMKHKDIVDLKTKLNWLGYGKSKVSAKFGSYFQKQVKRFQSDYQLPESGVVDSETKKKINTAYTKVHEPGDSSSEMEHQMNVFERLGFASEDTYESVSEEMKSRITAFQRWFGLAETGVLDSDTAAKLNALLECPLQLGKRNEDTIRLKVNLNRLGYGNMKITSKFGGLTEKKLKQFQADCGLPVNGIADDVTLEKIEKAL